MASTLNPQTELADGLREVVVGWLDEAADALAHGATKPGVHQARKACKRARAALDLLAGHQARQVSRDVAAAARTLSPIRDVDVLEGLIEEHGWSIETPFVADRDATADLAAVALRGAARAAADLPYARTDEEDLLRRLAESWRAARRAMRRVAVDPADLEAFHTWRKRVKRAHAQCMLLSDRHPALAAVLGELDDLQELLGTLHDLTVLREQAPHVPPELDDEIALHVHRAMARGPVALALRRREFSRMLAAEN